jgi:hypothetical protein
MTVTIATRLGRPTVLAQQCQGQRTALLDPRMLLCTAVVVELLVLVEEL